MSFFKTILTKIETAVGTNKSTIKADLTEVETKVLSWGSAGLHEIETNGGAVLTDAATAAVIAAETVSGTGEVKAAAAFAQIVGVLTKEGIPVVKNAINSAINLALADARAKGLIAPATPDVGAASGTAA